ncbi:MAG: flagellar protein FliS [Novosphingobium sp.]|nr:flagellar protein FliS [Novosphingobium sp.]
MAPARNAADTYRTVDFDARVIGASPADLTDLCYEQLIAALGSAIHAHRHADPASRSNALSRAVSCLLALEMGIAGQDGIAATLRDLYGRARASVLASVLEWDEPTLLRIRDDFAEIRQALRASR